MRESGKEEADMVKRTFVVLALAVVAATVMVSAQESATIILRSGERISGQLVDMGGSGFTVRVNGQDRQFPTNEFALIDFTGGGNMSQSDWDRVSGQHVIWLRNGETLTGQLVDIGGTSPLRITVRTDGNERNLTSNEVARIALGRPSNVGSGPGSTAAAPGRRRVTVPARQQWTPTGITVRSGERIRFSATGEIRIGGENDTASPSGVIAQRFDPRAPLPRTLQGALISRIGNGRPFGIGAGEQEIIAPDSGQLFLGINDSNVSDNEGEFQVEIETTGIQPRRR
jgi:hypothetical protein